MDCVYLVGWATLGGIAIGGAIALLAVWANNSGLWIRGETMDEDHEITTERQEPHLAEENFNDEETAAYMRWHITTNN